MWDQHVIREYIHGHISEKESERKEKHVFESRYFYFWGLLEYITLH